MTENPGPDAVKDSPEPAADSRMAMGAPAPSPLERRYRRLLRVLPAGYREVREPEMVDAFLLSRTTPDRDLADLDSTAGYPDLAEVASVVRLAVRLRWTSPVAPTRYRAWADAAHRYALAACLLLAAPAVLGIEATIWTAVVHPEAFRPQGALGGPVHLDGGLWSTVGRNAPLLWIVVFVLAVLHRASAAQTVAAVAAVLGLARAVMTPGVTGPWAPVWVDAALAVGATLALGAGHRRPAPPLTRRPWGWAAAAGLLAVQAVFVSYALAPTAPVWNSLDQGTLLLVIGAATAVAVVGPDRLSDVQRVAAPTALALLAGALTAVRGADVLLYRSAFAAGAVPAGPLAAAVTELVLLLAMTAVAAGVAAARFRSLPVVSYSGLVSTG